MKVMKPSPALRDVVKSCYVMDREDVKNEIKYNATAGFYLKASGNTVLLIGPATAPATVTMTNSGPGFAFSLRLGGVYKLFGVPASQLINRAVPLEEVLGQSVRELTDKIQLSSLPRDQLAQTENFLIRMVQNDNELRDARAVCLESIIHEPSPAISNIAKHLGLSTRHLQRVFSNYVGMNPCLFRRIVRFEKAVDLIPSTGENLNWSFIAYESGYSDQSHFIRDFREFAGCTPSEYRKSLRHV